MPGRVGDHDAVDRTEAPTVDAAGTQRQTQEVGVDSGRVFKPIFIPIDEAKFAQIEQLAESTLQSSAWQERTRYLQSIKETCGPLVPAFKARSAFDSVYNKIIASYEKLMEAFRSLNNRDRGQSTAQSSSTAVAAVAPAAAQGRRATVAAQAPHRVGAAAAATVAGVKNSLSQWAVDITAGRVDGVRKGRGEFVAREINAAFNPASQRNLEESKKYLVDWVAGNQKLGPNEKHLMIEAINERFPNATPERAAAQARGRTGAAAAARAANSLPDGYVAGLKNALLHMVDASVRSGTFTQAKASFVKTAIENAFTNVNTMEDVQRAQDKLLNWAGNRHMTQTQAQSLKADINSIFSNAMEPSSSSSARGATTSSTAQAQGRAGAAAEEEPSLPKDHTCFGLQTEIFGQAETMFDYGYFSEDNVRDIKSLFVENFANITTTSSTWDKEGARDSLKNFMNELIKQKWPNGEITGLNTREKRFMNGMLNAITHARI